jgi:small-conductance mechanosensitive channel
VLSLTRPLSITPFAWGPLTLWEYTVRWVWAESALRVLVVVAVAASAAMLAGWLSGVGVRRAARGRRTDALTKLHLYCHRPWTAVLMVAALYGASMLTDLPEWLVRPVRHALGLALIGTGAWLAVKVLFVVEDLAFRRFPLDVVDNRRMRRRRTQIGVLRRMTAVVITVLAVGAALTTFAELRTVGKSLIASAGIVGLVVGLAAHTTIGHAFAGLQLAFTDELRLDDVVVVESEWGRIEELRLTYVVVRLWDDRRLILPTTYFTTTPFESWTRNEAWVMGTVILHLDYAAQVEVVRTQTRGILETSVLWDRREWTLQVVELAEGSMVVRVVASAADAATAWDLRCELREGLIAYIQREHPDWLPRTRTELSRPPEAF